MTTPLETLTRVLTNAAADTRRTVAYYGNLQASGPARRPRRLLSEVGFPQSTSFSHIVPSASHVILYDPWWSPALEAQAIDRSHRIGQKKTVFAIRRVTKCTIEARILQLH